MIVVVAAAATTADPVMTVGLGTTQVNALLIVRMIVIAVEKGTTTGITIPTTGTIATGTIILINSR